MQLGVWRERVRWRIGASESKDGIPGAGGSDKEREAEVGGCRGERVKEATVGSCGQKCWGAGIRVHPLNTGLQGLSSWDRTGASWCCPQPGTWI